MLYRWICPPPVLNVLNVLKIAVERVGKCNRNQAAAALLRSAAIFYYSFFHTFNNFSTLSTFSTLWGGGMRNRFQQTSTQIQRLINNHKHHKKRVSATLSLCFQLFHTPYYYYCFTYNHCESYPLRGKVTNNEPLICLSLATLPIDFLGKV